MTLRKLVIASLTVTFAAVGAIGSAEAGKRGGGFKFGGGGFKQHHSHHKFHHRHHFGPSIYIGGGGGCGYYYHKWKYSGSYFWRVKYFDCIS